MTFKVPLKLYGGGNFALAAVKEIDVTEEYLEMSKDITKCQNKISLEECETKEYFEQMVEKCKCIPFKLGHKYMVDISRNQRLYISFKFFSQGPLCDELGRQCISRIVSSKSSCLTPCKGIYADVKRTPFIDAAGFSLNALHDNYSLYKRFQEEEIEFPSALQGCLDLSVTIIRTSSSF